MATSQFDWNPIKDRENELKHGVGFAQAQLAFADPHCIIAEDLEHSEHEPRFFCFGRVGRGVLTVRFTYRSGIIRILGAGYWRKGKHIYGHENQIHR